MAQIQALAKEGIFGPNGKDIATCNIPLDKACIHRKHRCQPNSLVTTGPLDSSHLQPGACISCDQLESISPGLIPRFKGTPSTSSYHATTLFVDHASRYLFFTPYLSMGAVKAVQAKQSFEFHASTTIQTMASSAVSSSMKLAFPNVSI
jgi:hypothetical protein